MSNLAKKLHNVEVEQPKKLQKTIIKKSRITKGEKFFYFLFVVALCFFSVKIIHNQAAIYEVNKEIQVLEKNVSEQEKYTQDLQAQVDELSEYGRLLESAKKLGLKNNENNVKVVQKQ